MTRDQVFWMLLVTVVMVLNGWRARRDNPSLAILMIAIPLCGWAALMMGK